MNDWRCYFECETIQLKVETKQNNLTLYQTLAKTLRIFKFESFESLSVIGRYKKIIFLLLDLSFRLQIKRGYKVQFLAHPG